jgi:hypothetical protein
MERSQGNSLYSYLKQKCLFSKAEDRKVKYVVSGAFYQWEWGGYEERCRRVNIVEILCTRVIMEKLYLLKLLRMGEEG